MDTGSSTFGMMQINSLLIMTCRKNNVNFSSVVVLNKRLSYHRLNAAIEFPLFINQSLVI